VALKPLHDATVQQSKWKIKQHIAQSPKQELKYRLFI